MRGQIDFIGFVKGTDDHLFLKLREKYAALAPEEKIRPVRIGPSAGYETLTHDVWLLESDDSEPDYQQATAFAADGIGLITAAHAVRPGQRMLASHPHIAPGKQYPITVPRRDDNRDVAILQIDCSPRVVLTLDSATPLRQGTEIALLGFPRYAPGNNVELQRSRIIQERPRFGVKLFVSQAIIQRGSSGGPVLNKRNEVIGIIVTGVNIRGRFTEEDEASAFVPITVLNSLT